MMKLAILQSGFITAPNELLVKSKPVSDEQVVNSLMFGTVLERNQNKFFYIDLIEELFNLYMKDSDVMKNFDYRRRLLKLALDAFNEIDITKWILNQGSSDYVTSTHKRFINDTITFVLTGHRDISIETWSPLLVPRLANDEDRRTFFITKDLGNSYKTTKFLANWTSQYNGFTDLLLSLKIIFGKR